MTDLRSRLGRIPSPPDGRDYRLENFLNLGYPDVLTAAAPDPATLAAQASTELKLTTVSYPYWAARKYPDVTATHWWKAFNALAQIQPQPPPPSGDVSWADPDPALDQGDQGTCVGHGCAQWGNTDPVEDHFTHVDAQHLYYEATILDGSPDDPFAAGGGQQGATVRSGMKVLQNRFRLSAYAVTYSVESVKQWLDTKGPVIMGTNFYWDMETPDATGYVRPTGGTAGGHCYLATGHLVSEDAIMFLNSWGGSWGLSGYFKMKYDDVATLLSQQGEAWVAVELPL